MILCMICDVHNFQPKTDKEDIKGERKDDSSRCLLFFLSIIKFFLLNKKYKI